MIREHDLEGLLDLWLAEGPEEVPDPVVEQALATIDSTNQVRAPFGRSWRGITMPKFAPVAIGTAAVLLVAVLGVGLFGGASNTGPGNPTAPPSPSASAPAAGATRSPASSSAVASAAPSAARGADRYCRLDRLHVRPIRLRPFVSEGLHRAPLGSRSGRWTRIA